MPVEVYFSDRTTRYYPAADGARNGGAVFTLTRSSGTKAHAHDTLGFDCDVVLRALVFRAGVFAQVVFGSGQAAVVNSHLPQSLPPRPVA